MTFAQGDKPRQQTDVDRHHRRQIAAGHHRKWLAVRAAHAHLLHQHDVCGRTAGVRDHKNQLQWPVFVKFSNLVLFGVLRWTIRDGKGLEFQGPAGPGPLRLRPGPCPFCFIRQILKPVLGPCFVRSARCGPRGPGRYYYYYYYDSLLNENSIFLNTGTGSVACTLLSQVSAQRRYTFPTLFQIQGPPKKLPTTFRCHSSVVHWPIAIKFEHKVLRLIVDCSANFY